jgi:hypothetical protein
MKKEAKWNLVFIVILVVALIPGAVILVKKKLDPSSHRMGGPDPVRKTTAYIDPFPDLPEDFRRLVPPGAEAWTGSLVAQRGRERLSYKGQPVVSEARCFEVLSFTRENNGVEFIALIWNLPQDKPPAAIKAKAAVGKEPVEPLVLKHETLSIPAGVREEFRSAGFIKPPAQAELVIAQFPDLPDPTLHKPAELMLQVLDDSPAKPDFVRIFTKPVSPIPDVR